ncbi:MAG: RNA-binding protein [Rhodospirillaceae bacterium]|nr:RNA-binding protein [Rhodospirillaceae bacterium]
MLIDSAMAEPTDVAGEEAALAAPNLRRCIVTRQALEKAAMIRFVLDPEGRVVPDLKGKLPGRGLWVTADRAVLAEAAKRNAFAKAARQSAKVPADLVERVAELARREVAELIGLARKSGQLRAGFEKVQIALEAGKVRVLIAASDGAEDGRGKLARLASRTGAGSGVEIVAPLTAAELAQALGREHAVHAAVAPSGIADRIIAACRRLSGLQVGGLQAGGLQVGAMQAIDAKTELN